MQSMVMFLRNRDGGWDTAVTQEWPFPGLADQVSYVVPFSGEAGRAGIGDVYLNYRRQVLSEAPGRPAFAPRVSVLLPLGSQAAGRGYGQTAWQVNLPFSKQHDALYFHWNAGFTLVPGVAPAATDRRTTLFSPTVAGSVVWQQSQTLNWLVEAVGEFVDEALPVGSARTARWTVAPGFRRAWNAVDRQLVLGLAAPTTFARDRANVAALVYFSYEVRFRR